MHNTHIKQNTQALLLGKIGLYFEVGARGLGGIA